MLSYNHSDKLTIMDVQRTLNQKQEKKFVCYEKVLQLCQKRIITLAEQEKKCCFFIFPEYVIGFPLFDLNACMEHCKKCLINNGFWVEYYFPNKFYISWDIEEIKLKKHQEKQKLSLSTLTNFALPKKQIKQNQINNPPPSKKELPLPKPPPPQNQNIHMNNNIPPVQEPIIHPNLQQKITAPLPIAPLKYNPDDIFENMSSNDSKTKNNTFFSFNPLQNKTINTNNNMNDMLQMLSSSIGTQQNKNLFDYKPSGKLSLNL